MKHILPVFLVLCVSFSSRALDMDRLRVQRKEVFEFTEKPSFAVDGDNVTIAFAVKDFCDVTVAIENRRGTIVRHIASGVLGKNAPAPFQKDSLKQTVVWDGKDEIGRYVDDKNSLLARVSLGLKARMEKTLYWSPKKVLSGSYFHVSACPEGVYVYFPGHTEQLILFDHQGNYVRTVYPFPAEKVGTAPEDSSIKDLKWQRFPPDNELLPSKLINHDQDSFLPVGSVKTFAVAGKRIVMVGSRLMLLGTDGSAERLRIPDPVIELELSAGSKSRIQPESAAMSPDGRRLYLACYTCLYTHSGYARRSYLHGVNVVDLTADPPKISLFAGIMKKGKETTGNGKDRFFFPLDVTCDAKGRVYVADNGNSRIQVFGPDGKFIKSIPTPRPGIVRVHPKTGEIWVVSSRVWCTDKGAESKALKNVTTSLRVLGPVENPKLKAAYPIPVPGNDYYQCHSVHEVNAEIDFATDPPTLWASVAPSARDRHARIAIRLYRPEGRKLAKVRDFWSDAKRALADPHGVRFNRPRLWVNPATGKLYRGHITRRTAVACKSFYQVIVIDPETGANQIEQMPTDPEDLGFDWEGRAYLRTFNAITRCDPRTWREIPYDYGDERKVYHGQGGGGERPYDAASAITLPSVIGGMFHMGGMGVAPDGTVAVSCINPKHSGIDSRVKPKNVHGNIASKPYMPPLYPGRNPGWETHIFDKHGKLAQADVTPGIGVSNYLQIDREGYVYILCAGTPYLDGKKYFNGRGCTLIKLNPGKMKCLTPGGLIKLPPKQRPNRPYDMTRPNMWVEGAEWLFGPVGADGHYGSGGKCSCYVNGRFALDYFKRSFAPEIDRFRVVVLDKAGNVILRIGRYGNVQDGIPLVKPDPALVSKQGFQPPNPRSIGGDEVAIMHAQNLAVHTDNRLFLADVGNNCTRSVKLDYHVTERIPMGGTRAH